MYIYIYISYVCPYTPLDSPSIERHTDVMDFKGNSDTFTCDSFTIHNNQGRTIFLISCMYSRLLTVIPLAES